MVTERPFQDRLTNQQPISILRSKSQRGWDRVFKVWNQAFEGEIKHLGSEIICLESKNKYLEGKKIKSCDLTIYDNYVI